MKNICQILLLPILLVLFPEFLSAQNQFVVDKVFFKENSFSKIKVSGYGDIWCQNADETNQLYVIKPGWKISDVSDILDEQITTEITDFAAANTGAIIGTKGQGLFYLHNDKLEAIDASILGDTVEIKDVFSISYPSNNHKRNSFGVCADSSKHSFEFDDDQQLKYTVPQYNQGKVKYIRTGQKLEILADDEFELGVSTPRSYNVFRSSYYKSTDIPTPNDFEFWDNGSWYWWLATDKGLYFNRKNWVPFLPEDKINELVALEFSYYGSDFLVASSSGLYLQDYSGNTQPQKIELGNDITAVNDMVWAGNALLLATDKGIVRMLHKTCDGQEDNIGVKDNTINILGSTDQQFFTKFWFQWDQYSWNFSDGSTSTEVNPINELTSTGYYKASFKHSNQYCEGEAEKYFPVYSSDNTIEDNFEKIEVVGLTDVYREIQCLALGQFSDDANPDFYIATTGWQTNKGFWAINTEPLKYDDLSGPFMPTNYYTSQNISVGDINNDGIDEVVASNENYGVVASPKKYNVETVDFNYIKGFKKVQALDFNNDGFNDVSGIDSQSMIKLFINNGDFSFSTLGFSSYISANNLCWADFNLDGYLDMIVTTSSSVHMYSNNGNSLTQVKQFNNAKGTYIRQGDLNNDGYPDFAVGSSEYFYIIKSNNLGTYEALDYGFLREAELDGRENSLVCFDMGDMNNDGRIDILYSGTEKESLFYNMGEMVFVDQSFGLNKLDINTGYNNRLMLSDLDENGNLDWVHINYSRAYATSRKSLTNNWIEFKLKGIKSNWNAIGARVDLYNTVDGKIFKQSRQITNSCQGNVSTSHVIHFGLGDQATVDSLKVFWPSGLQRIYKNINGNKVISLVENAWPNVNTVICSNATTTVNLPEVEGYEYEMILNSVTIDDGMTATKELSEAGKYKLVLHHALGNDTSEIVDWSIVRPAIAGISTQDDVNLCPHDSIKLEASGGLSYNWLLKEYIINEANHAYFWAKEAGAYQTVSIDQYGCRDTSDILAVLAKEGPSFHLPSDTSICEGNNLILNVEDAAVHWFTQEVNDTLQIVASDDYKVTVTKSNGCEELRQINVKMLRQPYFWFDSDTIESCNRPYVRMYATNSYDISKYIWSDGQTSYGSSRTINEPGKYIVEALGDNGCRYTDSIYVEMPEWPLSIINDTIVDDNTNLTLNIPDTYSVAWWNGSDQNSVMVNTSDLNDSQYLWVDIYDDKNCRNRYYFMVEKSIVGINKVKFDDYFRVHVSNKVLRLSPSDLNFGEGVIKIFNTAGQCVKNQDYFNTNNQDVIVNLNEHPNGIYIILMQIDSESFGVKKFNLN
ncbi:FG-GAP-like repeat-containing protein [Labilibacter marinus]|uniref:FG-GAP-like repeat-containing protein n=1 Tax=Labilibacter marinus TaxID=1477105 RepID=UPI00094F675D|nr:FG-GAP-like repeat-containing protein [Labilibacter marinus]